VSSGGKTYEAAGVSLAAAEEVVERRSNVVDARQLPLPRLHDHVDRPALELGQAVAKAGLLELLPGDTRLVVDLVLADPPVSGDQAEAELAQVASLDLPDAARDEVVVEQLHDRRDCRWGRRNSRPGEEPCGG